MSLELSSVKTREHVYSDFEGTYRIDKLFEWVESHPEKHHKIPLAKVLESICFPSSFDINSLKKRALTELLKNQTLKTQVMQANLDFPILVTNDGRLLDGIHKIVKSVFMKNATIDVIFINQSQMETVRTSQTSQPHASIISPLPIEDYFVHLPESALQKVPRDFIEDYFPDHLPTATKKEKGYEVRLERPSSPYGSFMYDDQIRNGLTWWRPKTRIRDIAAEYRLYNQGILALEEQWVPLSWSYRFSNMGAIPKELILLHLDDHQDMMPPRIGKRLDGRLVDYITHEVVDLSNPETVKSAIQSGAIGKGSILTPLIHQVQKIHVRHLTHRLSQSKLYKINPVTTADAILFQKESRLGLQLSDTSWKNLARESNYVVTPHIDVWLQQLPENVPIFLHFDLDYFNNRFDGSSSWESEPSSRHFDPRFSKQKTDLKNIIKKLGGLNLQNRVLDTSIGISPGFYPAEFWEPMVNEIFKELAGVGITLKRVEEMEISRTEITESKEQPLKRSREKKQATSQDKEVPIAQSSSSSSSSKSFKKRKIGHASNKSTFLTSVSVAKMASKKFEGWKIQYQGQAAGFVKFYPKHDKVFKSHVTVDFLVPKPKRGKGIGRTALKKAIESSSHSFFVANLRKSNTASKKALSAVGFTPYKDPRNKQLCMVFKK